MRKLVSFTFWTLDAFVAGLFVLAWLGRYVRPDGVTWPLQLIAIGFPYLTAAVAVLLVAQMLRRKWRSVSVHAVLLAFAFARYGDAPASYDSSSPPADTLALLTYNVSPYFGDAEHKGSLFAAFVDSLAPDVLTLQEGPIVVRGPADAAVRAWRLPAQSLRRAQGLNRATTRPCPRARGPAPGCPTRGAQRWPASCNRLCTCTRCGSAIRTTRCGSSFAWSTNLGGKRVAIYNMHLRSYGNEKPWSDTTFHALAPLTWRPFLRRYRSSILERANEADTLFALIQADSLPVVVSGDFNSTMHNWSYSRIQQFGLDDAWRIRGRGRSATYHVKAPIARIDFVLVDPRLRVLSADLIDETELSDHFPLLVRLAWKDDAPETQPALPDTTR